MLKIAALTKYPLECTRPALCVSQEFKLLAKHAAYSNQLLDYIPLEEV